MFARTTPTLSVLVSAASILALAGLASAQQMAASCDNRQGTTSADVVDSSDPTQNGFNIDPSQIYQTFNGINYPASQSVTGASASATLSVSSRFLGSNPGSRTTGFISDILGSITTNRSSSTSPSVTAQSTETTSVCLNVTGASATTPLFVRVRGNLFLNNGSTGYVRFINPSSSNLVNLTTNGASYNRVLRLQTNGGYRVETNFTTGFVTRSGTSTGSQVRSGNTVVSVTCPADFNGSGTITVQDIFDFLTAWFGNDLAADVNASGGVTVQDVFDFLANWFGGCV